MKQDDIKKSRELISLIIHAWRGNLYLDGCKYSDKELASFVGVNATAFSRLSNGVATASFPTYCSLKKAICSTIGEVRMREVIDACTIAVYVNKDVYENK